MVVGSLNDDRVDDAEESAAGAEGVVEHVDELESDEEAGKPGVGDGDGVGIGVGIGVGGGGGVDEFEGVEVEASEVDEEDVAPAEVGAGDAAAGKVEGEDTYVREADGDPDELALVTGVSMQPRLESENTGQIGGALAEVAYVPEYLVRK
jgi:hypothetical protein